MFVIGPYGLFYTDLQQSLCRFDYIICGHAVFFKKLCWLAGFCEAILLAYKSNLYRLVLSSNFCNCSA